MRRDAYRWMDLCGKCGHIRDVHREYPSGLVTKPPGKPCHELWCRCRKFVEPKAREREEG